MKGFIKVSWPRIFAEGVAIVVSILLAFWIQAWWENKQDEEGLHDSLTAVLDDFQESVELVRDRQSFASARQESIVKLFEIANDTENSIDESVIDGLLRDNSWYLSHVPILTTALYALLSSGKFDSLENETLRRNLADWPARIAFVETQVSVDKQYSWEIWGPIIQQKGLWPQIDTAHNRVPGRAAPITESSSQFPVSLRRRVDHSQLLTDNEFLNVLYLGWTVQWNVINSMNELDSALAESIALLRAELGL